MSKKYIIITVLFIVLGTVVVMAFYFGKSISEENRIPSVSIIPTQNNNEYYLAQNNNGYLLEYNVYIEKADLFSRQGKYEDVILMAARAAELSPDEPMAYNYLSIGYAGQKNYLAAIEASSKYIEIMERRNILTINGISRHADFLTKGVNTEEAIKFLYRYQERFPKEIDMYIKLLKTGE